MKKILLYLFSALVMVSCGVSKALPTQSSSTNYEVGSIYNQNGLKGIVVQVDASKKHGLIMSLEATNARWLANKELQYATNAFYDEDGEKNMQAIEQCIKEHNASWSDFPAFEFAHTLGDGWYIPSRVEIRTAIINLKAAFDKGNTHRTANAINAQITSYGGDKIIHHDSHISGISSLIGLMTWNDAVLKDLISSTEKDGGEAVWRSDNFSRSKTFPSVGLDQTRAFHKF